MSVSENATPKYCIRVFLASAFHHSVRVFPSLVASLLVLYAPLAPVDVEPAQVPVGNSDGKILARFLGERGRSIATRSGNS